MDGCIKDNIKEKMLSKKVVILQTKRENRALD
jgi:hypothetical protein